MINSACVLILGADRPIGFSAEHDNCHVQHRPGTIRLVDSKQHGSIVLLGALASPLNMTIHMVVR